MELNCIKHGCSDYQCEESIQHWQQKGKSKTGSIQAYKREKWHEMRPGPKKKKKGPNPDLFMK
jgi:hypothetical protein